MSPLLMDITMRFHCFKFAPVGDREGFPNDGVDAADRDALRFLWVQDPFAKEAKVEEVYPIGVWSILHSLPA